MGNAATYSVQLLEVCPITAAALTDVWLHLAATYGLSPLNLSAPLSADAANIEQQLLRPTLFKIAYDLNIQYETAVAAMFTSVARIRLFMAESAAAIPPETEPYSHFRKIAAAHITAERESCETIVITIIERIISLHKPAAITAEFLNSDRFFEKTSKRPIFVI